MPCLLGCDVGSEYEQGPPAIIGTFTVSTLPATGKVSDRAFVTDSVTVAFNVAPVSGGNNTVPVFWNGAEWRNG